MFDMCLNRCNGKVLSESYLSGNELLVAITAAVFELFDSASLHAGKVAGFGLLFQEDMKASEFNVMYSTGFSSASISLREALITQFRVPVTEEYSQVYTVSRALEQPGECGSREHRPYRHWRTRAGQHHAVRTAAAAAGRYVL